MGKPNLKKIEDERDAFLLEILILQEEISSVESTKHLETDEEAKKIDYELRSKLQHAKGRYCELLNVLKRLKEIYPAVLE